MKVSGLMPKPIASVPFRLDQQRFVPATAGSYVLATVEDVIVYVGLATSLRARMGQHLENPDKRVPTLHGRARVFHWLPCDDPALMERSWMNEHSLAEGGLPALNRAFSPVRT